MEHIIENILYRKRSTSNERHIEKWKLLKPHMEIQFYTFSPSLVSFRFHLVFCFVLLPPVPCLDSFSFYGRRFALLKIEPIIIILWTFAFGMQSTHNVILLNYYYCWLHSSKQHLGWLISFFFSFCIDVVSPTTTNFLSFSKLYFVWLFVLFNLDVCISHASAISFSLSLSFTEQKKNIIIKTKTMEPIIKSSNYFHIASTPQYLFQFHCCYCLLK